MGVAHDAPPPDKIRGVRVCFDPPNVTFFHSKLLLDNSANFTSSRMNDVPKMEGKTNFRGAYRLSLSVIVECLEITDVCNIMKQFDGST